MRAFRFRRDSIYPLAAAVLIAVLPAAALAQEAESLSLTVVAGDDAVNDISRHLPTPVIVELLDETGQPVNGARVLFTLPEIGPGGRFADGSRTRAETTDTNGRATLAGFIPNRFEGSFQIEASATVGSRSSTAIIHQRNEWHPANNGSAQSRQTRESKVLIVLGIGAAVVLGCIFAVKNRGGGASTPVTPATVTIGTISIGAPH
jgi:hypothetical protein